MEILKSRHKISNIAIRSHFYFSSIKSAINCQIRVSFQKPLMFEKKNWHVGFNFGTEFETYKHGRMLLIFSFYIIFTFYIMHIVFIVFMFHKHFKYILNNNNRNTVNNFQTCRERQVEWEKHTKAPQCKRRHGKRKTHGERSRTSKKPMLSCQKIKKHIKFESVVKKLRLLDWIHLAIWFLCFVLFFNRHI